MGSGYISVGREYYGKEISYTKFKAKKGKGMTIDEAAHYVRHMKREGRAETIGSIDSDFYDLARNVGLLKKKYSKISEEDYNRLLESTKDTKIKNKSHGIYNKYLKFNGNVLGTNEYYKDALISNKAHGVTYEKLEAEYRNLPRAYREMFAYGSSEVRVNNYYDSGIFKYAAYKGIDVVFVKKKRGSFSDSPINGGRIVLNRGVLLVKNDPIVKTFKHNTYEENKAAKIARNSAKNKAKLKSMITKSSSGAVPKYKTTKSGKVVKTTDKQRKATFTSKLKQHGVKIKKTTK